MIPPPITSRLSGTPGNSSAPVESTIRSSSGRSGSITARDPAAMIAWSNSTFSSPASSSFGEVNFASPRTTVTFRRFASPSSPPVSVPTTLLLPRAQLFDVDLRVGKRDPELRGVLGLCKHLRRMKKSLGRDATNVEANAADPLMALDQRHLQTEVGGAKSRRIPPGPRAHHHDPLAFGQLASGA